MSQVNTANTISPILKNVYPDRIAGIGTTPTENKNIRLSLIEVSS